MSNIPKFYALFGFLLAALALSLFVGPILSFAGAGPAWRKGADYAPLIVDLVLFACVLVLFARRFRPQVRERQRELARREGRTVGFYIGSIVVLLSLYGATVAILDYFFGNSRIMQIAVIAVTLAIGIGYQQWYWRYVRRSTAKCDAEKDTFW